MLLLKPTLFYCLSACSLIAVYSLLPFERVSIICRLLDCLNIMQLGYPSEMESFFVCIPSLVQLLFSCTCFFPFLMLIVFLSISTFHFLFFRIVDLFCSNMSILLIALGRLTGSSLLESALPFCTSPSPFLESSIDSMSLFSDAFVYLVSFLSREGICFRRSPHLCCPFIMSPFCLEYFVLVYICR